MDKKEDNFGCPLLYILIFIFAQLTQRAFGALRGASRAYVSAELHYAVAKIRLFLGLYKLRHYFFDLRRVLELCVIHTEATANSYAMGIGNDSG